jgi:hypothetical protein
MSHPDDSVKRHHIKGVFFYASYVDNNGIILGSVIELP